MKSIGIIKEIFSEMEAHEMFSRAYRGIRDADIFATSVVKHIIGIIEKRGENPKESVVLSVETSGEGNLLSAVVFHREHQVFRVEFESNRESVREVFLKSPRDTAFALKYAYTEYGCKEFDLANFCEKISESMSEGRKKLTLNMESEKICFVCKEFKKCKGELKEKGKVCEMFSADILKMAEQREREEEEDRPAEREFVGKNLKVDMVESVGKMAGKNGNCSGYYAKLKDGRFMNISSGQYYRLRKKLAEDAEKRA